MSLILQGERRGLVQKKSKKVDLDKAKELALSSQRIKQHIQNMKTEKIIYIPNKLINIVLS